MKRRILAFLLLGSFILTNAQTTGFLHYSVEDGLPQSQVLSLAQDKKGNLWVSTMAGASRFDGVTFKTISSRNGLAENWCTVSYEDRKGNVWIGHWAGGVSVVSADGRGARKVIIPNFRITKPVTGFAQSSDSVMWIATSGEGLIRFNLNANKADRFLSKEIPNEISCISSSQGNLYLACGASLIEISDCNVVNPKRKQLFQGRSITQVLVHRENIYFIDNGHLLTITSTSSPTLLPGPSSVQKIFIDAQQRLWAATYGYGVFVFDKISHGDYSSRNLTESEGLNFNFTNTVFQDRDHNIWIGTDLGLNLLAGEHFQLFDKEAGLQNSLVWSVLNDRSGNTYAGTGNGIFIRQASSKDFKKLDVPVLEGKTIISLYQDQTGKIWAGTQQSGLFLLNANKIEKHYSSGQGYPFERINRIDGQLDGSVWIATDQGAGRIDADGKISWFTTDLGLLNDYVTTVFVDSKDQVWLGYPANGMQSYASGRFTVPYNDSLLSHATILSIAEDRSGNIWAGAYGDGLFVFDGQKVRNTVINDGTNSESPQSLCIDDKNRIWFGTNRGVDCFDPATQRFQHFGKKRGFLGVETNINAISRDRNGAIWFGCLLGALKLDPTEEAMPAVAPIPSIEHVEVFYKEHDLLKEPVFEYEQNHLSFGFSAVYLKDPGKLRYQFMLEGFDKDWSPLTDKTFASYPNLPSGKYKFLVKSGFLEGVWSSPVEYQFQVKVPFWRTWWFNALFIGGITMMLMLLIELKARRGRKSRKQLELLVRERTIELGQKNMELARKNRELAQLVKEKQDTFQE